MIDREATVLRRRDTDFRTALDTQRGAQIPCTPSIVVKTYKVTTYPTTAASFFACHPCTIAGTEAEGAAVTITVDTTQTVFVANVGSAVPTQGTVVEATLSGGRWEMRFDG